MATVGAGTQLTLNDWSRRLDPDGKAAKIVEVLEETNEVLDDAVFIESNGATSHRTTIRSGLPEATYRLLNYGVQPSKSRTVQVTDTIGMLEAYAEVDKSLADLNGNTAEFRMQEDRAFLEAMNEQFSDTLFNGNTDTDPEKFMGLAPRYNVTDAQNAENVISGGGSGSTNTSIWLVAWGPNTAHCIFPKGQMTGLQHNDLGEQTLEDAAKGKYQGYRTHYKWDAGFVLRDWRYVVRICNVDVSTLVKSAATGADLVDLMTQAVEVLPSMGLGKPVFYVNKKIRSMLRRQIASKSNVNLTLENYAGKKVMEFDGIPVRRCDAISNTEATITTA